MWQQPASGIKFLRSVPVPVTISQTHLLMNAHLSILYRKNRKDRTPQFLIQERVQPTVYRKLTDVFTERPTPSSADPLSKPKEVGREHDGKKYWNQALTFV